ncbi:hypothetical protein F4009_15370 [Candidatus Poribacteria bacterium]|nr:hypothetical protein [Candidatus Poribacteria bacterium]MYH82055.1 hypothetical protein [Candidatus Poribacteria bacterium]MYK95351.1 hypothetical protein [Candidatus Poribacteria bacterium]
MMKIDHGDVTTWALPENAIARLGRGRVRDVAFSPDGTHLAVATDIGLWWYELAKMQPVALWETQRGMVSAVSFSDDGQWIATGNADGIVKVLDTQNQHCTIEIGQRERFNRGIAQLRFSPNGQHFAASRYHFAPISVWSAKTEVPIVNFTIKEPKTGYGFLRFPICFSHDGTCLAYLSCDNEISVSQIATGEQIARFIVHSPRVDSLIFSPCGQFLAAGIRKRNDESQTVEVHIWNIPKETVETAIEYNGYQVRLAYSSENSLRVADICEDEVIIWDAFEKEKLDTFKHRGYTGTARFSEDGQLFAIASARDFHVWRADTLDVAPIFRHLSVANSIIFSQKDKILVSGYGEGSGIAFWDIAQKQVKRRFQTNTELNNAKRWTSMAPSEEFLATSFLQTIEIWSVPSGTRFAEFSEPGGASVTAFSPTGERFASATGEGMIYVWDSRRWEKLHALTGHTKWIRSIAFRPDGQQLVSVSADKTAQVWDVEHGTPTASLLLTPPLDANLYKGNTEEIERALEALSKRRKSRDKEIFDIIFSPCGGFIAGGMEREIRLWDATTYETHMVILPPEESRRPFALAFSPCGRYLASGTWWWPGSDKVSIRLWNVTTGENIHTFWGHSTDVQNLVFSSDGTLLASGGFDGTVLLWDMKPYTELG